MGSRGRGTKYTTLRANKMGDQLWPAVVQDGFTEDVGLFWVLKNGYSLTRQQGKEDSRSRMKRRG